MDDELSTDPWERGDRVRIVRPDNLSHPRKGRVAVVVSARWFDATFTWDRGEPTLKDPGRWLVWVRCEPEGDAWDDATWGLYRRELVRLPAGPAGPLTGPGPEEVLQPLRIGPGSPQEPFRLHTPRSTVRTAVRR